MDLSMHPDHGTSALRRQSNISVLSKTLMSHMHKKCQDKIVTLLMLYVDDIMLIGNNVETLSTVKI
jgi:hypothetical protein